MVAIKLSLTDAQFAFLNQHTELGYASRSALIRDAIDRMRREIEHQRLEESAKIYEELYASDPDIAAWMGDTVDNRD
jgi:Arc/MetJ-type ribon-helix-helix transcriptional regulator